MAFADPQTVTINAVAQTLARVSSGVNLGSFRKDDTTVELTVQHTYNKRARRLIRLDHKKIAVDPLIPTNYAPYNMACYLVADVPLVGYSVVEQKQVIDGFAAYLTASSGAKITQLLGGEN
jgi:hypothetical protein